MEMSAISQTASHVLSCTWFISRLTKSTASNPRCQTQPLAFAEVRTVLGKQDTQQLVEDHPARAGLQPQRLSLF